MKKEAILSNDREVPLLLFLWKWKVSTTAALTKKFFQKCSPKTAYNRLLTLRHAGLIQVRSDGKGQKFVCTLDRKGFDAIREDLPELKDDGFKSEHVGHDLLVSAFHLGDWLLEKPQSTTFFSEQQLRRMLPEMYPSWVPRSPAHRPDGYTQTLIGDRLTTIAIEVELSNKREDDYTKIGDFYGNFRNISKVLWLVPKRSKAVALNEKMNCYVKTDKSPHSFIILEDFKNLGWHSEIEIGSDQGKSLIALLSGKPHDKYRMSLGSLPSHALLDTRKSPHTSNAYRGYQFGDFRD